VIGYALRRALKGMAEYRLLALATISTVATVLLLAGSFALVLTNLSGVLDRWGKDVQVSCYLDDAVPDDRLFAIKAELEAQPEVVSVRYVSKDEALERFGEALAGMDRLLADLDENPLPASLEVRLAPTFQDPGDVARVAEGLRRAEFVDIDYSQEWVERFHSFLALLRLSSLVLGTLLLLAAMFLVSNTIRLAIYARRDELEVVGLVGGTRAFARLPFLLEGSLQGGIGAAVAIGLLGLLYRFAFVELQDLLGLLLGAGVLRFLSPAALLFILAAGVGVGLLGAWTSVVRAQAEGL